MKDALLMRNSTQTVQIWVTVPVEANSYEVRQIVSGKSLPIFTHYRSQKGEAPKKVKINVMIPK